MTIVVSQLCKRCNSGQLGWQSSTNYKLWDMMMQW